MTVGPLASIGRARARLDRGHYAMAAQSVSGVPTGFVYNTELEPNFSSGAFPPNLYATAVVYPPFYADLNVTDREGSNGLNFVSGLDPRLVLDTTLGKTPDGTTFYLPAKFEANLSFVPLATGIEARLIEAEAALQATQPGAWAQSLNALRADTTDTKVAFPPATVTIAPDSTTLASQAMQIDVMFRERAFWLFGTGTRLGDLRRLVRQYGRDQGTVFPSGSYARGSDRLLPHPLPNYGTDVSLTLPTAAGAASGYTISDPAYKGCLTSTKTA